MTLAYVSGDRNRWHRDSAEATDLLIWECGCAFDRDIKVGDMDEEPESSPRPTCRSFH